MVGKVRVAGVFPIAVTTKLNERIASISEGYLKSFVLTIDAPVPLIE